MTVTSADTTDKQRYRDALGRVRRYEAERNAAGLISELESEFEHGPVSVAGQAARALARLGDPRYADRIRPLVRATSASARFDALMALRELHDAETLPLALVALSDNDSIVRAAAAKAIAHLGGPNERGAVAEIAASDADLGVRLSAATALVDVGDRRAEAIVRTQVDALARNRWRGRRMAKAWRRLLERVTG
jgi:HEAT repeat protein